LDYFEISYSQNVTDLLQVLERIKEIAHSHPPVDNKASRFGNPGFREFYDHLDQVNLSLFKTTHDSEMLTGRGCSISF
jgi:serine/threonine-protein phosphatase 2A activator